MNQVPARFLTPVTTASWVVVPETIHQGIPNGCEVTDEQAFRQGDPYLVDHEKTAEEIARVESVLRIANAVEVPFQSAPQFGPYLRGIVFFQYFGLYGVSSGGRPRRFPAAAPNP